MCITLPSEVEYRTETTTLVLATAHGHGRTFCARGHSAADAKASLERVYVGWLKACRQEGLKGE